MVGLRALHGTSGETLDLAQISADPEDCATASSTATTHLPREGMNVSVAVTEKAGMRSFHGAGKVQASNEPHDMRLQRMLGHLSALAVKKPERAGRGVRRGVTAGSFVVHPDVKQITICDIEPVVPKFVTPYFTRTELRHHGRHAGIAPRR